MKVESFTSPYTQKIWAFVTFLPVKGRKVANQGPIFATPEPSIDSLM
jgi:hypothetical protein